MLRAITFQRNVALAAGGATPADQSLDIDKPFLLRKMTATSGAAFGTRIEVAGTPLMRARVPNVNLFGVGALPTILTAPYYIPAGKTIRLDILPLTVAPDTARINFIGVTGTEAEIRALGLNLALIPYWYHGNVALAAGGSNSVLIPTDTDHSFRMIKLISSSTGTYDADITANGDKLTRGFTPNVNTFGTAQLALAIDPFDVNPGEVIQVDALDTSGAPNAVNVTFMGHKVR